MLRQRHVLRELIPRKKPDCRAAGLEERNSLAGDAKFSRETKRFVKGDTGAHVADAERDHGKPRDGCGHFLIHSGFPFGSKTGSTVVRCASAARNGRWSVSNAAC